MQWPYRLGRECWIWSGSRKLVHSSWEGLYRPSTNASKRITSLTSVRGMVHSLMQHPYSLRHRRWIEVMFAPVFCFVCEQDISKKNCRQILTKLGGQFGCVTRTNWFDFGEAADLDTIIFQVILHNWEIQPKTTHITIFQKSYGQFMTKLGGWVG